MFSCFLGQPRCFATLEEPGVELKLETYDVRHHFLRELVRQGDIIVNHVPSEYQHAGILTKVLAFDLFAIHPRFLMNLSD